MFQHILRSTQKGEIEEALVWVRQHSRGKYHLDLTVIPNYTKDRSEWHGVFSFENEIDATAFRLRW